MSERASRVLAVIGLGVGGLLGMAGAFAPSASLRGLLWGMDGAGLVMASALLTLAFQRTGHDIVAAGFLVFAVGEGIILSGSAMELRASTPLFGAGATLWAVALTLISSGRAFSLPARALGLLAALLLGSTGLRILAGAPLTPLSAPLPFYAYPVFVATMVAWMPTILRAEGLPVAERPDTNPDAI